jgi:hypothetical protein
MVGHGGDFHRFPPIAGHSSFSKTPGNRGVDRSRYFGIPRVYFELFQTKVVSVSNDRAALYGLA